MSKNEGNQKLKFLKPSDLAWNAPYISVYNLDEEKNTKAPSLISS